ncbi:MAG: tetratricopeptide repeat protein [Capnocytophaga sp.]|nr:tetratricopeptide repeat protein [Capnocytophaga sp.]
MSIYKKNNFRPNRKKHEKVENEITQTSEQLAHESTTAEVFQTLDEKAGRAEAWVQNNQRTILGVIATVVVLGLGYLFYQQFVSKPHEKEASNELSYPLQTFNDALNAQTNKDRDSLFTLSLNGANGRYGFLDIIKNYNGTKASNIANYSAGMAYLQLNKYKEAIIYLDKFSSDDEILSALALGNIGDAFSQLKQYKDALDYYQKAVKKSENTLTAPIYLKKAGQTAIELKDYNEALRNFEKIKENYPKSEEARTIDIDLSFVKTLINS